MNPAKLLDDVLSTLSRYAPIIVVHVFVLFWLSIRVLDPTALPSEDSIWLWFEQRVDTSLKAIGLSFDRWYVLAVFAIAYMAVFQWTASLLSSFPFLRIVHHHRYSPKLLRYASHRVARRPALLGSRRHSGDSRLNVWDVSENLRDLVEHFATELQESGRQDPYQWYVDRLGVWNRRYSALLVALAAMLLWAFEGGSFARSEGRVWEAVILLAIACGLVRWQVRRIYIARQTALAYWALRELERGDAPDTPDDLDYRREDLVEKLADFELEIRRHPTLVLRDLLRGLPQSWQKRLDSYLAYPPGARPTDWPIVTSSKSRSEAETQVPPRALRVDAFTERFAALLECTGSGLCILVPRDLGLAPSVAGQGAVYSFAERAHDYGALQIELWARDSLEDARLDARGYGGDEVFLCAVGAVPIEILAQETYRPERDGTVEAFLRSRSSEAWPPGVTPDAAGNPAEPLTHNVPLVLGSSYLLLTRTRHGLRCLVAFQCFRLAGSEKLLMPWRILWVEDWRWQPPEVLPWWQPAAWREVLRRPEGR